MPEPNVVVLLISPLEDIFAVRNRIPEEVLESYRTLTAKGMKILFTTRLPLGEAAAVIAPLDPPAPLLSRDEGLLVPKGSHFLPPEMSDTNENISLSTLFGKLRQTGDIIIPVGIGRLPEHAFLNEVELAALLPGSELPDSDAAVYHCQADGPAGWSEWAETMLRRIHIILSKSEMRQWNGT